VSTDTGGEADLDSENERLEVVEEKPRLFSSIRRRIDGAARATPQDTSDSELVDKGGFRDLLEGEAIGEGPVFYNTYFSREQLASALALSERIAEDEDMARMLGDRSVSHSQAMVALREARPLAGMRVLDLGCGQVPSFALAAQALGADMYTADAHDIEDQATRLQLSGDGAEPRHTIVNFNDPQAAEILRRATRGNFDLVSQSNLLPVQGDLRQGIGLIDEPAAYRLAASLLRPGGHYWNGKLYRRPAAPDTNYS
jgi:nucleotide-binding universal stress UspA family protein